MDLIRKYFPEIDSYQSGQFEKLLDVLPKLNQKVNVISRKDVDSLEERHVLHSLSIALQFPFEPNRSVIDAGTGGGFPGIPLAVLFPETRFLLVDSIGKKINLVRELCEVLELKNVTPVYARVENLDVQADYVVSRAVTAFPKLWQWTRQLIIPGSPGSKNGLIALKGGDLEPELATFKGRVALYPISRWFDESFFSTKMIVFLKK